MKKLRKVLALVLTVVMLVGMTTTVSAAEAENGFDALPAGTYTYVDVAPVGGEDAGQVQFNYWTDTLVWAYGDTNGVEKLTGDELRFFQGVYLSDHPVTDWLNGATKDVDGYAGAVAGNVHITFTEDGKISAIYLSYGPTRVTAVMSEEIAAPTLSITGTSRRNPLAMSCITLMGSVNALSLTETGDVIMDNLAIGNDGNGHGLYAMKGGGDTFVVGTVTVDGIVEWYSMMGVILPLESEPGTLETNGHDIIMTGGSNIGRVGRTLNLSTGVDKGGNIIIGQTVSTDSSAGGKRKGADTSTDGVTLNTSGSLTAGLGDVIIGTNTEKAVYIDLIGNIQGANVIIRPDNYGKPGDVTGSIGDVTATKDIDIQLGSVNAGGGQDNTNATHGFTNWESDTDGNACVIGTLATETGNITLAVGDVNGSIGNISAAGVVNVTVEHANSIGEVTGSEMTQNIGELGVREPEPPVVVEEKTQFAALPAGTYTYVCETPVAEVGSGVGQVQFTWADSKLNWAFGGERVESGSLTLTGDELEFFQSLYQSDLPVYDWLASAIRSTDGYAGNLSGNLLIELTEYGKISMLRLDSGLVQATAAVTKDITADTLTISGATRGQPNLLHSCLTLIGTANCLYLTAQGNVVLDNMKLYANKDGIGLKADKIGGDTFIAGTVFVDGKVEWLNRYANIQPVHADTPATLETNGQDIVMGGMNIGRVGRNLTITTGADKGGNIIIGQTVSVDHGRGGALKDPSTGTLILSTTGDIIAGLGDVIIGTNTYRKVTINSIGNVQGANVTIAPTYNGTPSDVSGSIGNITATDKAEVVLGNVDTIGEIAATEVVKQIGGKEKEIFSATPASTTITVDGEIKELDAYIVHGNHYIKIRDLAYVLSGSAKQYDVYWQDDTIDAIITLTTGRTYTEKGGEMGAKGTEAKDAEASVWNVYLDGKKVEFAAYTIGGTNYFKLRDMAAAMNFAVEWDATTKAVAICTDKEYSAG